MANVKLTRLKIEKYRNVAPGTELVFNDTFNIPLGQNGTGKTTLLDLIAMIVKSDFATLKDEEFSFEYDICFLSKVVVSTRIENRHRRREGSTPANVESLSIGMETIMGEMLEWEYSVAVDFKVELSVPSVVFKANPHNSTLQAGSGEPQDTSKILRSSPFDASVLVGVIGLYLGIIPGLPLAIDGKSQNQSIMLLIFNTAKSQVSLRRNAGRFDEALGGFDAMTGSYSGTRGGDLSEAGLSVTRKESRVIELSGLFVPYEVQNKFSQKSSLALRPEDVRLGNLELPFLQKVVDVFKLASADISLRFLKKEVSEGREKISYGDFELMLTLDDGTIISHDLLSYGQKRLLSFFYYVAAIRDVIIADELVNGLHYDWIEACLREIGDRQSFLTSQNPLLLDFLPFESAEQVQHTFILCRKEKRDGKNWMVWSNMSTESAETFFRAYKTEALQVSEILRSRGLW